MDLVISRVVSASRNHAQATKSSAANFESTLAQLQQLSSSELQRRALSNVGKLTLGAAGGAAALRGLMGLAGLVQSNVSQPVQSVPQAMTIDIPVDDEERKQKPRSYGRKFSADASFLKGDLASSLGNIPWYYPAMFGGGVLGAAAGYHGADKLMDWRRKKDVELELAKAKAEYEAALASATGHKRAENSELGTNLDTIYDAWEKVSGVLSDIGGHAVGGYGVYSAATGLAGAIAAYNWAKKRQRRRVLEQAQKARMRRRSSEQPTPLMALPRYEQETPESMKPAPSEETQEGDFDL